MIDQEMLQAISQMMDEKLEVQSKKTDQKLEAIKEDIEGIKEDLEGVRTGVNTLLEWAEKTSHALEFPLPKVIE